MEHIDAIIKMLGIIVPVFGGLVWLQKKIESGQNRMMKKITKIDKHKVSYKVCDQRRAECPCNQKITKERIER